MAGSKNTKPTAAAGSNKSGGKGKGKEGGKKDAGGEGGTEGGKLKPATAINSRHILVRSLACVHYLCSYISPLQSPGKGGFPGKPSDGE